MIKKSIKSLLSLIIVVLLLPILVCAKSEITLVTDKVDLEVGDEVNVTALLSSDTDLYALIATLNYDKDVFETIDTSDFKNLSDTIDISYSANTNKFGIINKTGEISSELFSIRLKVKADAKVGDTNIALTNISASDGKTKITFAKTITKVLVTRDAKDGEVLPQNNPNKIEEIDEGVVETFTLLPYVITFGILGVITLGLFIYVYMYQHNRKKLLISLILVLIVITLVFSYLLGINLNKNDVNNDGYNTYEDAKEIMEYLINLEGTKQEEKEDDSSKTPSKKPNKTPIATNTNNNNNNNSSNNNNNYDVNNDGKVDIEDVGDNTEHVTEEVKYKVILNEKSNEEYYVAKGKITLNFSAQINPSETVKKVKINDKYYDVSYNGSYYTVVLDNITSSGEKEFKFSTVTLSNNREIKVKFAIKKEVLKDTPYVDLFNIDDENNTFNFKVEDPDNALISGNVIVVDNEGKEVLNEKITKNNHFTHEFAKEKTYLIYVYATYDLDSNKNDQKNLFQEVELYKHTFSVESNYDFKISNVSITDAIEKGEKVTIAFDSKNNYHFNVEYIIVNGKEYRVTALKDNHFEFRLDDVDTSQFGKYHLNIEAVVLNNLKEFILNKDYELSSLSYNVLKNAPEVKDITLQEDTDNKSVIAHYTLNDKDATLTSLDAVLVDSTGKILDTKKDIQNSNEVSLSYGNNSDGRYIVKFLANYNLGTDRHNFTEKNIGQEEIFTQSDIYILNVSNYKVYPTKNENKYTIKYELYLSDSFKERYPNYNEVAGITINGLNYDGNKDKNYSVVVGFTVPSESGVINLEATRVKLQHENYQTVEHMFFSVKPTTIQIDVLKDKPTIEDFTVVSEDYEKGKATFRFNVQDDKGGFEVGTINLYGFVKQIHKGLNEVTFENIPQDRNLELSFYGNFDLDTNTLENQDVKENYYTNELITTLNYGLFNKDNYDKIEILDLRGISKDSDNYFEKNEDIKLSFKLQGLDFEETLDLNKVVINNQEYDVTKENAGYYVIINGYGSSGERDIVIDAIILNNGKKVNLTKPSSCKVEVLKDPVKITDFKYTIENSNINVSLSLKDEDKSLYEDISKLVTIKIYDESNNLLKEIPYSDTIKFSKINDLDRYNLRVYASYDRDIERGKFNNYTNIKLVDEIISLAENNIQLKKIKNIRLFTEEDGKNVLVEEVNFANLQANKDKYFVEITMQNMPTVYAKIKNVINENGKAILVLDYKYATDGKTSDLRVEYGSINNGVVSNETHPETFLELVARIKENPSGEFNLVNDYDASDNNLEGNALINIDFSGILHGNGYTIKNLDKPLFNTINGGTVENLKLEGINFGSNSYQGGLANKASKAMIRKVYISDFTKRNSNSSTGALVGELTDKSLVENCRVINLDLDVNYLSQGVGSLVGVMTNSTIKDSYSKGKITGGWNYRAAFVGNASNSEILNSYTQVSLSGGSGFACSFACSYRGGLTIKNSVSLSNSLTTNFTNGQTNVDNYQLVNEYTESTIKGVTNIVATEVEKSLFTQNGFSEELWNLKKTSVDNAPTFNDEKVYVLDLDEIEDIYDENKETLYNNLMLLMPFYNSKKIATSALAINEDSLLYKEEIKHLIPVDDKGNVVTYLTTDNLSKIKKLKIVYNSGKKEEYTVRYDKTYDMVASYRITELKIDYTYNHYVINSNSQLVNNLTNYLLSLTYEDNLDPLTVNADSRLYKEFYYEETRGELKEFVLKYLANSNYTNTLEDETIDDYLESEIKKDKKLEKILYVYNYFKRFYSISIDGVMLNDLILFDFQGFSQNLDAYNIALSFLSDNNNIETNRTNNTYQNLFAKYTGLNNMAEFLEYLVKVLSDEKVDTWYKNTFQGYIVEIPVDDKPEIMYTLWSHLSHVDKNTNVNWYNYILPIATLPKDAAYIISTPVQFIIGAQRTYITDPSDPNKQAELQHRISTYVERMREYFKTASKLIDVKYFNDIHTMELDKRYTYDINGNQIFQGKYTTEEPFHKNFNEVLNQWAYNDYNAATANGAQIIWRVEGLLDGDLDKGIEYTYHTWSHETAHNIDARLFLENNGRRFDAGGEDYADSNLMQAFGDGDIVMNLSRHFNSTDYISSNLEPERIDSYKEIQDFYSKLFETIYIMDYLEGRAILKLNSEDISKLVVQASYPNANLYPLTSEGNLPPKPYYKNYLTTVYQTISQDTIANMQLQTINDLYNNNLVMFPGVIYSTYTDNRYGGENIYKVRWYQPHNDYGRPDSYSIKWFAYEMLGYKGYKDGYIEYFSNINSEERTFAQVDKDGNYTYDNNNNLKTSKVNYKTDLMAIRKITDDPNMDFATYKINRFKNVEKNLANIKYIDVNSYYHKFYEALKLDAEAVKKAEIEAANKYPNDTAAQNKVISEARKYSKSTEVRRELFYTLKNESNDFIESIYDSNNRQVLEAELQNSIVNSVTKAKEQNIIISQNRYWQDKIGEIYHL